ncbi:ABC-F family ATP-binding cassette domain-containing protein [Turneriella parva]|uniref:ABC transporter related protein n=1 Tax=Turneriella parva (strain ATCC BAA-1111 / DSM 21527 / NCTC 11395 / H) TaxID=869212 RepID=I4BAP2_TURPD|nr:ABC-F family ATP-binding cassette domain-containing protein [Turneriella parva]AFM14349.1 ABC transporter related protein [Turneriella parva DSM 21527]
MHAQNWGQSVNYLSAEKLTKVYGAKTLFQDISFGLDAGEKKALIARNGAGKSTLMQILVGRETPDKGRVVLRNGIRLSYLDQSDELDPNMTIAETVFDVRKSVMRVIARYDEAMRTGKGIDAAIAEVESANAWDYERKITGIFTRLGIRDTAARVGSLSGGERKRVALAHALIDEAEILILDEPTNHLDLDMIEWLESYLQREKITLLLVTHDRYFLETVCDEILELDNGQLYSYKGNYSYFLEKKAEREEAEAIAIEKAQNKMRRELEWIRKQPKARTTKAKYRVDAFEAVKAAATQQKKEELQALVLEMNRVGGKILEITALSKSFGGRKLIHNFEYKFVRGDRIGIIGRNGAGKSTFLNLITGLEKPDSGKVDIGLSTVFGYYRQTGGNFPEGMTILEAVRNVAEAVTLAKGKVLTAAQLLEQFLFPPSTHRQQAATLSGGEKRRLYLLTILMQNPNFLILDEPTNDLDIATINVLEDYLLAFQGCLLIVSHDRYFMDKLTTHLFVLDNDFRPGEEGEVKDFNGNYSMYLAEKEALDREKTAEKKAKEPRERSRTAKPPQLTFAETKERDALEKEIPLLEARLAEASATLAAPGLPFEKTAELGRLIEEIGRQIEAKTARFLELLEKAG